MFYIQNHYSIQEPVFDSILTYLSVFMTCVSTEIQASVFMYSLHGNIQDLIQNQQSLVFTWYGTKNTHMTIVFEA